MSRGKFNKSCCRVALPLAREIIFLRKNGELQATVCGLAKWRKSKHKCSVLYKSSIEELNLNLALNPPFCQTAVMGWASLSATNLFRIQGLGICP